jgi:hypothetical protein
MTEDLDDRIERTTLRDEALLRQALKELKAENEMLREVLKDADNELARSALDWRANTASRRSNLTPSPPRAGFFFGDTP